VIFNNLKSVIVHFKKNRYLLLFLSIYLLFLLLVTVYVHSIEDNELDNPELDFYVGHMKQFGEKGAIVPSVYRPAFYQVMGGTIGKIAGDYFKGGQIVSVVSGAVFVAFAFFLARLYFNQCMSFIIISLTAFNIEVIKASVRVATDMLCHSFLMIFIFLLAKAILLKKRTMFFMFLTGCALGFAVITRYNAALLFPIGALVVAIANKDRLIKALLCYTVGFFIVLSPQLAANYRSFGNPIYNENWRNMAFHIASYNKKASFVEDFGKQTKNKFTESVIKNPLIVVKVGSTSLLHFLNGPFQKTFFFNSRTAGDMFLFLCIASSLACLFLFRRRLLFMSLLFWYILFALACVFPLMPRLVLIVIPVSFILFFAYLVDRKALNKPLTVLCLLVIIFYVIGFNKSFTKYRNSVIRDDLYAIQWLEKQIPKDARVMGTSLFLGNHSSLEYVYLDSLAIIKDSKKYKMRVIETVNARKPDWFIVNPVSSYGNNTPEAVLLAPNEDFPFLVREKTVGRSIIFKIVHDRLPGR
jgi:hypothetical protein